MIIPSKLKSSIEPFFTVVKFRGGGGIGVVFFSFFGSKIFFSGNMAHFKTKMSLVIFSKNPKEKSYSQFKVELFGKIRRFFDFA